MSEPDLEIRTLTTADEMSAIATVFQQVWGSVTPLVGVELLRAIAHSGGYVSGAFDRGNVVGASFGFLARHHDAPALHSHVTGILPGVQHGGIGRAIKHHQRAWAVGAGLDWITWTYDPLVRRNAWFNIEVLGARIAEYVVDFYGPMSDVVNASDGTDRLVVAWAVTDGGVEAPSTPTGTATGTTTGTTTETPLHDALVRVPTPIDIVVLRRTEPSEALRWRYRVRAELGDRMAAGGQVIGFTRDGDYLVRGAA